MPHPAHLRFLLLLLILPTLHGCGILLAPIAFPSSFHVPPFEARGQIVDELGQPLNDVVIDLTERRINWDPLWIYRYEEVRHPLTVNSDFHITGIVTTTESRCVYLTFHKPGYYPVEIDFLGGEVWHEYRAVHEDEITETPRQRGGTVTDSHNRSMLMTPLPDTKPSDPLHVVLQKQGPLTQLQLSQFRLVTRSRQAPADPTSPILLDATRDNLGQILVVEVPGWTDRRTPHKLKLSIPGTGNGFLPAPIAPFPTVERQLKQAPPAGYADLILTQTDLERLLYSPDTKIWFYIKIAGQFGRGCIHSLSVKPPDPDNPRASASIALTLQTWLQPDGTRNLETGP